MTEPEMDRSVVVEMEAEGGRTKLYDDGTYTTVHADGSVEFTVIAEDELHDCTECGMADAVAEPPLLICTPDEPAHIRCWSCGTEWEYRQDGTTVFEGEEVPVMIWAKVER